MMRAPEATPIESAFKNANLSQPNLHLFDELESTSLWIRDNFMGSVAESQNDRYETQLCATDWQTAGIARRGKSWQTKPGNITFSMLSTTTTSAKNILGLSLVTGIGIADCLEEAFGLGVQLKWPNDVLVNDAKLGGLLTEVSSLPGKDGEPAICQVLTGVGVNYVNDPEVLKLGIGATSLEKEGFTSSHMRRDELIGRLAASVLSAHQNFYLHGWSAFAERWNTLDWLLNKKVIIQSQQASEQSVARGVNEHGALLVEKDESIFPVYSGEVSIRPTV